MKWLHNLLKGMSLTACLFVFQACYGTPPGYPEDFFEPDTIVVSADQDDPIVAPEELAEPETPELEVVE